MSTKKLSGKATRSNSKQTVSNPVSVRKRFSSLCTPPNNQVGNCVFCQKFKVNKFETYGPLLNKALFSKYSSSQNYYYSKDINDILDNESTPAVVYFRDLECIVEDEEYLKRFYVRKDTQSKIKALLEYYKYHKDIPRLFMIKVYITINKFHEKKRRIEYASIKRKLNIPDEDTTAPKKKEKKKQKYSDEDLSVGKLKNLLRDLKLEQPSYHRRKEVDVSSSLVLHQFVQMVGKKYDALGQISGLLSINQSRSYFIQSTEISTIQANNYMTNKKQFITTSQKHKQIIDSKITKQQQNSQQLSQQLQQGSFEKLNFNKFNQITNQDHTNKGEQSKKSDNMGSPFRNQSNLNKRVYSQIEGFTNFVQKQQQQIKAYQATKSNIENKKVEHSRKISANFNQSDYQLRLPSRQNSISKQAELQTYQVNFLKNRVASQMQQHHDDEIGSPTKIIPMTERAPIKSSKKAPTMQTIQSQKQVNQKLASYAVATLKNLQIKQTDKQPQKPLQIHFRTKSTDTAQTYRTSPPKVPIQQRHDSNPKDPLRFTSNIFVQGSGKKSVYNINQNNIVNIYIEDLKQSGKNVSQKLTGGSQTARVNSPLRNNNARQIFEVYNTHRTNQSPQNSRKKG